MPLAPSCEAQARRLGERLKDVKIDRAVASPLCRARRTAEYALTHHRLDLGNDPDLIEISHGGWEGLLAADIEHSHGDLLRRWRAAETDELPAGPDAETLRDIAARAWRALERACAGLGADDTVLIVAHDAINRVLLCRVLGMPLTRVWAFRQSPATLNILRGETVDSLVVDRLNDCDHVLPIGATFTHAAL